MTITDLFQKKSRRRRASEVYAVLVARAREPVFYVTLSVPDTLDGRFDLLALHAFLVLEALRGEAVLAEALVAAVFRGFEDALRDQGAGDVGMVNGLKRIADAFYGRLKAYGDAVDEEVLLAVLIRNLYRGEAGHEAHAQALVRYVAAIRARLTQWRCDAPLDFGTLPG
jgi:cytochrome b pre-mRNA-processing protein 3